MKSYILIVVILCLATLSLFYYKGANSLHRGAGDNGASSSASRLDLGALKLRQEVHKRKIILIWTSWSANYSTLMEELNKKENTSIIALNYDDESKKGEIAGKILGYRKKFSNIIFTDDEKLKVVNELFIKSVPALVYLDGEEILRIQEGPGISVQDY